MNVKEEHPMSLTLTSTAFENGGEIPSRHTCEGEDVSPALAWTGVPEGDPQPRLDRRRSGRA